MEIYFFSYLLHLYFNPPSGYIVPGAPLTPAQLATELTQLLDRYQNTALSNSAEHSDALPNSTPQGWDVDQSTSSLQLRELIHLLRFKVAQVYDELHTAARGQVVGKLKRLIYSTHVAQKFRHSRRTIQANIHENIHENIQENKLATTDGTNPTFPSAAVEALNCFEEFFLGIEPQLALSLLTSIFTSPQLTDTLLKECEKAYYKIDLNLEAPLEAQLGSQFDIVWGMGKSEVLGSTTISTTTALTTTATSTTTSTTTTDSTSSRSTHLNSSGEFGCAYEASLLDVSLQVCGQALANALNQLIAKNRAKEQQKQQALAHLEKQLGVGLDNTELKATALDSEQDQVGNLAEAQSQTQSEVQVKAQVASQAAPEPATKAKYNLHKPEENLPPYIPMHQRAKLFKQSPNQSDTQNNIQSPKQSDTLNTNQSTNQSINPSTSQSQQLNHEASPTPSSTLATAEQIKSQPNLSVETVGIPEQVSNSLVQVSVAQTHPNTSAKDQAPQLTQLLERLEPIAQLPTLVDANLAPQDLRQLMRELCTNNHALSVPLQLVVERSGLKKEKRNLPEGDVAFIAGGKVISYVEHDKPTTGEHVVLCASGSSNLVGKSLLYSEPFVATDSYILKGKEGLLLTKYLYFWLSNRQQELFGLAKESSRIYSIPAVSFDRMEILLPNLVVQAEIVALVEAIEQAKQNLTHQLDTVRQQEQEMFTRVFPHLAHHFSD